MDELSLLRFNYDRRFGVEIELNSFDKRDFKAEPLSPVELPEGIKYVANLLMENVKAPVKISKWHHTHNNFDEWVCKPDSSCGIEVCSPASKGWTGLNSIVTAIDALSKDENIKIDGRCSFHVHIDVEDCCVSRTQPHGFTVPSSGWSFEKSEGLAAILAWWIKCEAVFLDSVPDQRKRSRFAACIGCADEFYADEIVDPATVIGRLAEQKYFTCNCYHLGRGKRPTIEFRIIEREGCLDPFLAKNWIRLLVHFVEMSKFWGLPDDYLWLDPKDVFSFLGFSGGFELSAGLRETRNWFLSRILSNMEKSNLPGVWSKKARSKARKQAEELASEIGLDRSRIGKYLRR